jgi:hypothetical protein
MPDGGAMNKSCRTQVSSVDFLALYHPLFGRAPLCDLQIIVQRLINIHDGRYRSISREGMDIHLCIDTFVF